MSTQLNFTETLRYDEDAAGIKLRNLKLAIVDYDNLLYLGAYEV